MHTLIKPNKLSRGDTIATITLSWGGAGLFPYRYEVGKRRLEEPMEPMGSDWIDFQGFKIFSGFAIATFSTGFHSTFQLLGNQ